MTEPKKTPKDSVREWIEKAEHDLKAAEHILTLGEDCLLTLGECPFDTVTFHAQQCVEKSLKAALVCKGIDFPKTHDLALLCNSLLNK